MASSNTEHLTTGIVSVILAIVGVAILAELLSLKSNTTGVVKAGGGALSQALCTALSPIMGGGCGTSVTSTINFGTPPTNSGGGGGGVSPICFGANCNPGTTVVVQG
jgi:hypothetical protein